MKDVKSGIAMPARLLLVPGLALALISAAFSGVAVASSELSPNFLEVDYQDPLTAAPPLERPQTRSCRVRLMDHAFASSFGRPFVGTYTPPADCPAPWSMVAMDWNGSVKGRQFDRLIGIWLGGVEIFRSTTPEPSPAGIKWHVEKDVSQYAPVLTEPQSVVVSLENVVNNRFTGIFNTTVDLTFYTIAEGSPPVPHPDQIVPISTATDRAAWFFLTSPSQAASKTLLLPSNIIRARLEVYASPHACEEFWYANATDEFVRQHPQAGPCKGGAFREILVSVDDTLAGVATPFPVIYTGGINPFMWRPIPSVQAFDIAPYVVDLTPVVGILTDGRPHIIAIRVANATARWNVDGDLLLDLDHGAAITRGALLKNTIQPAAQASVEQTTADGAERLVTEASRSWMVEGFVDTSAGRIVTRVRQEASVENQLDFTLTASRELEIIRQRQRTTTITTVTDGDGEEHVTKVVDDFPLQATSDFSTETLANGHRSFTLFGEADVALKRRIAVSGSMGSFASRLSDHVVARGLLVRDTTTDQNLAADGLQREHFVLVSPSRCFNHLLKALHGFVTDDRLVQECENAEMDETD